MLFLPTRVEKVQAAHITTHIRHLAMVILAFVFLKQIVNFIIRFSRTPSLWQAMKCQSTGNSNFHQPDINHASTTYQHMSYPTTLSMLLLTVCWLIPLLTLVPTLYGRNGCMGFVTYFIIIVTFILALWSEYFDHKPFQASQTNHELHHHCR